MSKNNTEVVREGWLIKSPPTKRIWRARWRRRWFMLRHSGELPGQFCLEYYTDRNCRKLKGTIDLDQCEQVDAGLCFEQRKLKYPYMFDVKTPSRTYYLAAESEADMNEWVDSICHVCGLKAYSHEDTGRLAFPVLHEYMETQSSRVTPASLSCIPETPPLSPVSGPYIPISECVTGRPLTSSLGMQDFQSLLLHNMSSRSFDSASAHVAPPTPLKRKKQQQQQQYGSATDIADEPDPRFYDLPRQLRPQTPGSARHFERPSTPPLQSPTDSESVFTDDEWAHPVPPSENGVRGQHPSDSSADAQPLQMSVLQSFSRVTVDEAPPRPPKPSHLGKQPNYFNLKEPVDAQSGPAVVADDMYDFPRSHQRAEPEAARTALPPRHCYNNAAPATVNGHVFRYELSETEGLAMEEEAGEEPPSPRSQSSCSTAALYSNLPSPLLPYEAQGGFGPPVVNRGLKPGRKLSDSSIPEPSSPKPAVDRKLKPHAQTLRRPTDTDLEAVARVQRAAPSPNPDDDPAGEQIYFFPLKNQFLALPRGSKELDTLQYLDLDLGPNKFSPSAAAPQPQKSPKALTVYKTVDFVKTEALKSTRQHIEAERKQCNAEP